MTKRHGAQETARVATTDNTERQPFTAASEPPTSEGGRSGGWWDESAEAATDLILLGVLDLLGEHVGRPLALHRLGGQSVGPDGDQEDGTGGDWSSGGLTATDTGPRGSSAY
ncbi:hypothetical protein GCM10010440_08700 [Kitasatospora cinereorecta]